MRMLIPIGVFAALLGGWTWKLLEPNPVPATLDEHIPADGRYWLSKGVHLGAYALLALLAGQFPLRLARGLILLLVVHAVGTEIAQLYVPHRHGSAIDVAIDWCGIAAGLGLSRWLLPSLSRSARSGKVEA